MSIRNVLLVNATVILLLAAMDSTSWAHYLWVAIEKEPGEHGTAHIYFEEGPAAGDGKYLDPFIERGTTYIRTIEEPEPAKFKVEETKREPNKRWISGAVPADGPRSIDSDFMFGVYRYGNTDVLLHYYARHLDVSDHDDLHELSRAENMKLDIVPHEIDGGLELQVLWQGKPAADRTVYIRGPKRFRKNLKTDSNGHVQFEADAAGTYLFRTNVEEPDKSGTQDGKEYQLVRHHATLSLRWPLGE